MNNKKANQKLSLKKTTVAVLNAKAADCIKGGITTFNKGCPTPGTLHTCASFDRAC
jgi:hypothetical protein